MSTPRAIIGAAIDDDLMMYQQSDYNADVIIDALNVAGYVIVSKPAPHTPLQKIMDRNDSILRDFGNLVVVGLVLSGWIWM